MIIGDLLHLLAGRRVLSLSMLFSASRAYPPLLSWRSPKFQRNPNCSSTSTPNQCSYSSRWIRGRGGGGIAVRAPPHKDKVCNYLLNGSCHYKDGCQYVPSRVGGESFAFLTLVEGHQKVDSLIIILIWVVGLLPFGLSMSLGFVVGLFWELCVYWQARGCYRYP